MEVLGSGPDLMVPTVSHVVGAAQGVLMTEHIQMLLEVYKQRPCFSTAVPESGMEEFRGQAFFLFFAFAFPWLTGSTAPVTLGPAVTCLNLLIPSHMTAFQNTPSVHRLN